MILAIIQARTGSTRLPGKMTAEIEGRPIVWHVINGVKQSARVEKIVLATTDKEEDKILLEKAQECGVESYAGSEDDVLDRYYQAARKFGGEIIVRVTGDCPLIDPEVIDKVVNAFEESGADYASNVCPPTYPDGLDVEVFSFKALENAWKNATLKSEREHVTPYITKNIGLEKMVNVENDEDLSHLRLTVDEQEDLELVREIIKRVGNNARLTDILLVLEENPELLEINKQYDRNEGYQKSLEADEVVK